MLEYIMSETSQKDMNRETIIKSPGGFRLGTVYATLGGFYRACVIHGSTTVMTPFSTFQEAEEHVRKTASPRI